MLNIKKRMGIWYQIIKAALRTDIAGKMVAEQLIN